MHVNDASTWRQVTGVHVNDAGTWREVQEVSVNDAGTWRSVFTNEQITISNSGVFHSVTAPADATVTYRLANTGAIQRVPGTDGTWITPQVNMANYEARATIVSGSLTSGTTGSWLNLGTTRAWSLTNTGGGDLVCVFTLEIRRASDSVVMGTATITLTASVE